LAFEQTNICKKVVDATHSNQQSPEHKTGEEFFHKILFEKRAKPEINLLLYKS